MAVFENPDFQNLPQPLAALFAKTAERSFFASSIWYHVLASYGTDKAAVPVVYADAATPRAALACLAPQAGKRQLAGLANYYSTEHGPLYDPADAGWQNSLAEVAREIMEGGWHTIRLPGLDRGDPGFAALADGFAAGGGAVQRYFDSGTWYEDSNGMDFARYLAARPTNLRNTYKRKSQKLGTQGEFVFHGDAARIEEGVADYERVYRTSWKGGEPFPDFMPQLIRAAAGVGALRLGVLKIGGEAAAAQCWIVWQGRATIYKLAHDGRFDAASPGTILTMRMMERVLETDRPREVDFGRGDDGYKKLWLGQRRERWGLLIANPSTLGGRVASWREGAKGAVKRLIRRGSLPVGNASG